MSDSLESLVKKIKAGEDASINFKEEKEQVKESSNKIGGSNSASSNSFESIVNTAERLDARDKYLSNRDEKFPDIGYNFSSIFFIIFILVALYWLSKL